MAMHHNDALPTHLCAQRLLHAPLKQPWAGLLVEGTLRNALVPKLRRWFRSRLEEVFKTNGTSAMCTLVDIITKLLSASKEANTCPALLEILQEWEVKAAKARGRLPLGQFAWSEVLHNIRPDEMKLASYTNPLGVVRWEPAISSVCATVRGLGLGWNANGLRKRLETETSIE